MAASADNIVLERILAEVTDSDDRRKLYLRRNQIRDRKSYRAHALPLFDMPESDWRLVWDVGTRAFIAVQAREREGSN